MKPLLEMREVTVTIPTKAGTLRALDTLSFSISQGEIVGLVGESGSGKSMTARSILRILPESARLSGQVLLGELNLVAADRRTMDSVRGSRVAMIFQEPGASLNPVIRIGDQITEVLRVHKGLKRSEAKSEAASLLTKVGIPEPVRRMSSYPHELSGGMKQRVSIAIAFACDPDLLIADEPTTALDVTIQAQILLLLRDLANERGTSLLLISHDLGVVGQVTDRMLVMYAGRLMESGSTEQVLSNPVHPYTEALLLAAPSRESDRNARLPEIQGAVPDLISVPAGCAFHPRCSFAEPVCSTHIPIATSTPSGGAAACWVRNP